MMFSKMFARTSGANYWCWPRAEAQTWKSQRHKVKLEGSRRRGQSGEVGPRIWHVGGARRHDLTCTEGQNKNPSKSGSARRLTLVVL